MLITPDFIYIHQPKTGGTFVTATLRTIHEARGDPTEIIRIDPATPAGLPAVEPGLVVKPAEPFISSWMRLAFVFLTEERLPFFVQASSTTLHERLTSLAGGS